MSLPLCLNVTFATKHITSHRDLFTSLESVPHGNSVTCANNASYPIEGVGNIVLIIAANGSSFTFVDALYVPGLKKNLLSVSALARLGFVVKFVDDRCTVHDLSSGDEIVVSSILCRGLYKLTLYDKCGQNFANAVLDTSTLCSDQGGEYMSHEFNAFLARRGIKHQCTVPYTPQQNGVAERKNRSLTEMARCMVKSQALPHLFWLEATMCATYVLNRCPPKSLQSITPYEAWHDRKLSIEHMRVFGSLAHALVPQTQRKKLDVKAVKCIFVGYSAESKALAVMYWRHNVSSQDIYDTLLPLFNGGSTNVNSNEANVQPMGVSKNVTDQPIIDVNVHDVLDEERAENEQARGNKHMFFLLHIKELFDEYYLV
ncbi:hypothetical protein L7F22_035737 [Adiantum nelumboides]|nr:hypothetical protein [Adiantum nelumboides]